MAYCDQCGAYIPDGQSTCLACGYDETEAAKAADAAATAAAAQSAPESESAADRQSGSYYSFSNEELKARLAQQRKKQREESRRWAEEEKARRKAAKEQQAQAASAVDGEGERLDWDEVLGKDDGPRAKRSTITGSGDGDSKLFGALSYLGLLFLVPMIFRREDRFAQFHAKQGLVLYIFNIVSRLLGGVPLLGVALKLFRYYCIYKGMSNAINGGEEELPYIGRIFR